MKARTFRRYFIKKYDNNSENSFDLFYIEHPECYWKTIEKLNNLDVIMRKDAECLAKKYDKMIFPLKSIFPETKYSMNEFVEKFCYEHGKIFEMYKL